MKSFYNILRFYGSLMLVFNLARLHGLTVLVDQLNTKLNIQMLLSVVDVILCEKKEKTIFTSENF